MTIATLKDKTLLSLRNSVQNFKSFVIPVLILFAFRGVVTASGKFATVAGA